MDSLLAQKAVGLALEGKWEDALAVNQEIISSDPTNTEAFNRLAHAYSETGNIEKAKEMAKKVLEIDPANNIAQKCLERWEVARHLDGAPSAAVSPEAFLEESGKTKIINLLNLGDSSNFANLDYGDEVFLSAHSHRVSIVDHNGKYLGKIPDDLAARLKTLLKAGNKYTALIKSIGRKEITVFIREIENKTDMASFPLEKIDYVSFTPPELVHKQRPETSSEEVAED